jgi:hypothetical protein
MFPASRLTYSTPELGLEIWRLLKDILEALKWDKSNETYLNFASAQAMTKNISPVAVIPVKSTDIYSLCSGINPTGTWSNNRPF